MEAYRETSMLTAMNRHVPRPSSREASASISSGRFSERRKLERAVVGLDDRADLASEGTWIVNERPEPLRLGVIVLSLGSIVRLVCPEPVQALPALQMGRDERVVPVEGALRFPAISDEPPGDPASKASFGSPWRLVCWSR